MLIFGYESANYTHLSKYYFAFKDSFKIRIVSFSH